MKITFNKKFFAALFACVFLLGAVGAAVIATFHETNVDIHSKEARSSVDLPFTLSCMSGETVSHDITIQNDANVNLMSNLAWNEQSNDNGVVYTVDGLGNVTTDANSLGTYTVSITCDQTTPEGNVTGVIAYTPTK